MLHSSPHHTPHKTSKLRSKQLFSFIFVGVLVGLTGFVAILTTQADTSFVGQETESGNLATTYPAGGAVQVKDPNASEGAAVRFTGVNYRIISVISPVSKSRCLDNRGEKETAGNPVIIFNCIRSPAQGWTIETGAVSKGDLLPTKIPSGTIRLSSNPSYCLDVIVPTNADPDARSIPVTLEICVPNKKSQQWTIAIDGKITSNIKNMATETCLDVGGNDPDVGSNVGVYTCKKFDATRKNTFNQGWYAQGWADTTPGHVLDY